MKKTSLREAADRLAEILRESGHEAFYAGGCVRDALLGSDPKDYDIVTDAKPLEVMKIFKRTIPVGAAFGVVKVLLRKFDFEVATYRRDGDYQDGRRPETVEYSDSKEEDVHRRDFTINALLMNPETDEILDYVEGRQDLENGIIRAVGDAERRIGEDRLRMLRAVRFAARLGFSIEENTWKAVLLHGREISGVSPERIVVELSKIWHGPRPAQGFTMLVESGLLEAATPFTVGLGPERARTLHTQLARLPEAATEASTREAIAWATLTDVLDADAREQGLRTLKFSRDMIKKTQRAAAARDLMVAPSSAPIEQLRAELLAPDAHLLLGLQAVLLAPDDPALAFVQDVQADLRANPLPKRPMLGGQDLMALGIQAGPKFKEILQTVDHEVLGRRIADKDAAIALVKTRFADAKGPSD